MLRILLVGDKPSSKNTNPNIAFVGTASHKRIEAWLEQMNIGSAKISLINRVDPSFQQHLIYATLNEFKIVALGEEAALALMDQGVVNFFKLPHPSGRNRKLNDAEFVKDVLNKCKLWLES